MNKPGYLVISLDFELLWGVFDVVDYKEKEKYFQNTRKVIPLILDEFRKHEVEATWAIVGMLFNRDWEEWEKNVPSMLPAYSNKELDAYQFGRRIKSEGFEEMVFAPELIKRIKQVPGQEIGTHTYSHFYCLEHGQDLEHFKADLIKAIEVARGMDVELNSLVFPRNQLRTEYLKICADLGIKNVRSNPDSWYWKDATSEALLNKVARSGDAYFPLGKKGYSPAGLKKEKGFPLKQKASRFLRPVEGNSTLRKLKISRVKREMKEAAKNGEVYHLWWHPHNFGEDPKESIKDLRDILEYFEDCRVKYNFQSVNMQGLNQKMS